MTRRRLSVPSQPLLDFFILVRDDDGRSVPFSSCAKQPRGNDGEWSAKERLVSFFDDLKNSRSVEQSSKCRIEISRERPWFINSQSTLVSSGILFHWHSKRDMFFLTTWIKIRLKMLAVINHTTPGSLVLRLDNSLKIFALICLFEWRYTLYTAFCFLFNNRWWY